MDERQEKKAEKDSYEEALAKVLQSLKGTPPPTDFDPFEMQLRDVPDRFRKN